MEVNIPLCGDSDATEEETMLFLGAFLQLLRPGIVVEAGTFKGHFAEMAAQLTDATVFTADPGPCEYEPSTPQIVSCKMDFSAMLDTHDIRNIDVAFIDSGLPCVNVFEAGIRFRHYEEVHSRMRSGGVIVTHDVNTTDWVGATIIRDAATILFPGGRGLALEVV